MRTPALILGLVAPALAWSAAFAQAQGSSVPRASCSAPPQLRLEEGFVDPRRSFTSDSGAFRATSANFEAAFRRACSEGIAERLTASLLVDYVLLRNSPDANVASIFPVSINRRRGTEGLLLEYPLVTHEGAVHVPTTEEIHEAIYCRAVGATAREQEEDGRCLPD